MSHFFVGVAVFQLNIIFFFLLNFGNFMKVVARFVFSRTFVRSPSSSDSVEWNAVRRPFFLPPIGLTDHPLPFLVNYYEELERLFSRRFFSHTGGQLMAIQKTRNGGGVSPTLCNTTAIWRGGGGRWLTDRSNISCVRNKGERWMWIRLASGKSEGGTFGATSSYWKVFFGWPLPQRGPTSKPEEEEEEEGGAWRGGAGRGGRQIWNISVLKRRLKEKQTKAPSFSSPVPDPGA